MPAADTSPQQSEAAIPVSDAPARFQYATKTALSLTLAYLIPMAMGWPQPQTAATTVMLIAATGMLSESLQKGVLRVLGTVAGAVIGLSLIALFPQDRLAYLLSASLVVSIVLYLYNAYQGDSTLFMLTAVVILMVFNGGDAEGAFLWGVDRAFMTAFGVLVYTVVASLLWPVRTSDNTRALAATVALEYSGAFSRLAHPDSHKHESGDAQLADLLGAAEAFQSHLGSVKHNADSVSAYLGEWNAVAACYQELQAILLPALKQPTPKAVEFSRYIDNYHPLIEQVESMFQQTRGCWQGQRGQTRPQALAVEYREGMLDREGHLTVAAVASRAELLDHIQQVLLELLTALDSLLFDCGDFKVGAVPRGNPRFVWLDLENFKTALRAFVTFWIATAIWIEFNPPGGFMFVTLSTVLVVLVSYTPVTPKLLIILFSLGFMFALPAYVFLLPQMTHWLQLAAFLFVYAFIGFYVFQGPVSIFFLLGLFTLGIQSSMSYNFNVILLIVLMFYLVCALLIISIHFPFTSKPERLYASLHRRFFTACARSIALNAAPGRWQQRLLGLHAGSGASLLGKMHNWGAKIDPAYFPANGQDRVGELNRACDLLYAQLHVQTQRNREFASNPLIASVSRKTNPSPLAELCHTLAHNEGPEQLAKAFDQVRARLAGIEERLDEFLGADYRSRYSHRELAQFYVYLNLQASILGSIQTCREAQQALDWHQLGDTRF